MNGKSKGSEFERSISKKLSKWLSLGKNDDLFWRTQNSGGRFTCRVGKRTLNQEGDITSTSSESEFFINTFYIECKNYKEVDLWSIFKEKGLLIKWVEEYYNKSLECNKILLLIIRQNYSPIIILTPESSINKFEELKNVERMKIIIPNLGVFSLITLDGLLSINPNLLKDLDK